MRTLQPTDTVSSLMREIVCYVKPQVFSVDIITWDYNHEFCAIATLRGAKTKAYSASHSTPEEALVELINVLDSLVCPCCHRLKENKEMNINLDTITAEEAIKLDKAELEVASQLEYDYTCNNQKYCCGKHSPTGWLCTRLDKHVGIHIANPEAYAIWDDGDDKEYYYNDNLDDVPPTWEIRK